MVCQTVLCCAVLCSAVLCSAVLCCAMHCGKVHHAIARCYGVHFCYHLQKGLLVQVCLKWNVQRGVAVIPRSQSPKNIKANIEGMFDWILPRDAKVSPAGFTCLMCILQVVSKHNALHR